LPAQNLGSSLKLVNNVGLTVVPPFYVMGIGGIVHSLERRRDFSSRLERDVRTRIRSNKGESQKGREKAPMFQNPISSLDVDR